MQRLLAFLYRFRVFGYFLFLELLCVWLLTRYNRYYNASFFNSSNFIAAQIQSSRHNVGSYIGLKEINNELAEENARLRKLLASEIQQRTFIDSTRSYEYLTAEVINNDFQRSENYLTINKGQVEGVLPGMGVISSLGVVGIVKSCSKHFSTVTSLLHQDLMVSSELSNSGTLCTTQWDIEGPLISKVRFIPRHIEVHIGDSVVTSGFNSIFPQGLLIGSITDFDLPEESPFYEASIRLATDFTSLDKVYIVKNQFKSEIDSLEQAYD
jgi:rod shape-determining protein MreC